MTKPSILSIAALSVAGATATQALAQDSGALIEALVQEGILKESKAEEIRAKLSRDYEKTSAGKIKLDTSVKELKLSGDARLRFQHDINDAQAPSTIDTNNVSQADRFRLRLRINADYKVSDNFFAGFGLQTNQANDSGMQTFASGNNNGDYFQNYNIYLNKAFIGWNPIAGVTLIGGKQRNPFYTTDLVWDADINPTGFTERIDLNKVFNFNGFELALVAGQLAVSDNPESNPSARTNRDGYIHEVQLIASAQVNAAIKATVAPAFYFTNGASVNGNGGGANNGTVGTTNWATTDALQGLKVVLLPGDIGFKLVGKKTKFLWDVAYNLDARRRDGVYAVGANNVDYAGRDKLAWLVGFEIGENKNKGDWSFLANYRQIGLAAIDPLINDSDWAASNTNVAGYKASLRYNLGKATTLALTYQYADNLRKSLGAGLNGIAGPGGANSNSSQIIQADLDIKF
ncbi:MAG: putative porin [Verrucomicrobiota bacterium]